MKKTIGRHVVPNGKCREKKESVPEILSSPQVFMIGPLEEKRLRNARGGVLKSKPLRGRTLTRGEKVILEFEEGNTLEAYVVETTPGTPYLEQPTMNIRVTFDPLVLMGSYDPEDCFCGGLLA